MVMTDFSQIFKDFAIGWIGGDQSWSIMVPTCLILSFWFCCAAFGGLWAISVLLNFPDIVDFYWGIGFTCLALLYSNIAQQFGGFTWDNFLTRPPSETLLLGMLAVWGIRLTGHLLNRAMKRGWQEDFRYAEKRIKHGSSFWWKSLITIFAPAALVQWAASWCLMFSILSTYAISNALRTNWAWSGFDVAGFCVWFTGFLIETIADWQLSRFKEVDANRDKVFNRGLWSFSRHPNHFGESLMWFGYFITSLNMLLIPDNRLGTAALLMSLASPIIMTWSMKTWTGSKKVEERLVKRRPGYTEYMKNTSHFIPTIPARTTLYKEHIATPAAATVTPSM
jgi:steroid 5-alpha reductase family enzyme